MDEWKQLTVIVGPRTRPSIGTVVLQGVPADTPLTPKLARQAARVAHGIGWAATVWDEETGIGYRLYEQSARRLTADA